MVAFNAHNGLNALDLTGLGNLGPTAGIQQTVATNVGAFYDLSFYVGRAQSNNGLPQYQNPSTVDLSINGGLSLQFTNAFQSSPGFIGWEEFSTSFTATTSSTTITFLNGTALNTNYAGLDNVSLNAVPEPSGIALFGLGIACFAIGYAARKRKLALTAT